jgi:sugar lactone lactonase YvrE
MIFAAINDCNLLFPEGPRWHAGRLWLSDQHGHKVYSTKSLGPAETIASFDDMPSGLGFLPNGDLLVACIRSQQVRRVSSSKINIHADLSAHGFGSINDMIVSPSGFAYVGQRPSGYCRELDRPGWLVLVRPDGTHEVAAEAMSAANGMAIAPDGRTLIVAETQGHRLTSFSIAADGSLADREMFADLGPYSPDGICMDTEGAVWVAVPYSQVFLRVRKGGEITDRVPISSGWAVACTLAGTARKTLVMVIGETTRENLLSLGESRRDEDSRARGWIETADVNVPGAGWP